MSEWRLKSGADQKLEWMGAEGALLEEHDYIFISKKGEEPFIEIQKSMHELNDFCVTLFASISSAGTDVKQARNELWDSANDFENGIDGDVLFAVGMLGYKGDDFGRIFSPASAVVLLYATLIRSLHAIALHYGETTYRHWQSNNKYGAEIPPLIDLLESICKQKIEAFEHPQFRALVIDRARRLRNKFMHGDWMAVERDLVGVGIRRCFETVSYLFGELEKCFDEDKTPSGKVTKISLFD